MNLMKRIVKLFKQTRNSADIKEITSDSLRKLIKENPNIQIVDIRSPQEYQENRIRGAINIPLYDLKQNASKLLQDKNKIIILYCQYGERSKKAYKVLEEMGYTNIYSLKGGLESMS